MSKVKMPTLIDLMESGAHFGHKKERSSPFARDFVYTIREGILVIDLEKTLKRLSLALEYLKKTASEGKTILFVGTKRQASELVSSLAQACGMPYVSRRWLGGTLTNFETVRQSIERYFELEKQTRTESFINLPKKEKAKTLKILERMKKNIKGLLSLTALPDVLFIIDPVKENIAVLEARRKGIPIVAVTDTNANPRLVDFPIPANDDAPKTIELILSLVSQAILEGTKKKGVKKISKGKKDED